jgi:PAS domain-containing protein
MLTMRLRWLAKLSGLMALNATVLGMGLALAPSLQPLHWLALGVLALVASGLGWWWANEAQHDFGEPLRAALQALDSALISTQDLHRLAGEQTTASPALLRPALSAEANGDAALVAVSASRLANAQGALATTLQTLCAEFIGARSTATHAAARESQLFEAHPDALICIEYNGAISRANPAAMALLPLIDAMRTGLPLWQVLGDAEAAGESDADAVRCAELLPPAVPLTEPLALREGAPHLRQRGACGPLSYQPAPSLPLQ